MDHPLRPKGALTAFAVFLALLVSACASTGAGGIPRKEYTRLEASLRSHITTLASDDFGGRRPGTRGETLTLDYMKEQFTRIGFESGTNDPGFPWLAPVLLVSSKPLDHKVELVNGRRTVILPDDQTVFFSYTRLQRVEGAEILFIGKALSDFSPALVQGRIVLALWSESSTDTERQLLDMGASAVVNVVEDAQNLDQARQYRERVKYSLPNEEDGTLHGYVTDAAMAAGFGEKSWADLKASADDPAFKPELLKAKINIETSSQVRELRSNNFIAKLPGRVPGSGAVLLVAHWDHLGTCGDEGAADRICNGAVDNASGVALMIELSRRLAADGPHDRDIYALGTTAEEYGLLGAKAFVESPPVPLDSIVAAFNFDTVAVAPNGKMLGFIGQGQTPLDPVIISTLYKMKRKLAAKEVADRFFGRQDAWVLLNRDVPAVTLSNMMGNEEILREFMDKTYHRPNDDVQNLVLGGAIDDLLLHEALVKQLASVRQYPGPGE